MGTVLVYRNDKDPRFCEIVFDNGDHVQLYLDKSGLVIERTQTSTTSSDVLFRGDTDTVTDMCVALLGNAPATDRSTLDVMASTVLHIPSASHVRDAFRAAADAL